ncbi:MAG: orotate phosphoribosyltransferase [Candidatus Dormibacteraeota bacterium]|nr:orotate phosphoribosyltransferase [Candidatus Dormibacteraeota bacterium]
MPRTELQSLADEMRAIALLEGNFVLRSGRTSRFYFDKYLFECEPRILRRLGVELGRLVPAGTQRLACPELGAVLLGGAVAMETGIPMCIVRKEAKDYGTAKAIEGHLRQGEKVCLVEDVLTTGGAALAAATTVRAAGGEIIGLVGVLDREEGAAANLAAAGIPFHALLQRADVIPD